MAWLPKVIRALFSDQVKLLDSTKNPIDIKKTKGTFVIGAGFGRTGTSSLQLALNQLGWRSYHMREAMKDASKMQLIIKAAEKKLKLKEPNSDGSKTGFDKNDWDKYVLNKGDFNWNDIFETDKGKYNATLDFPMCAFVLDLVKYYEPNYKVVLTVRDDENKWYKSVMNTISKFEQLQYDNWFIRWLLSPQYKMQGLASGDIIFGAKWTENVYDNEENAKNVYNAWIECIKKNVPKDKLLVFNVKEGWNPLCKFLEIDDIPKEPFPRSNESKELAKVIRTMKVIGFFVKYGLIIIIAIIMYFIISYYM